MVPFKIVTGFVPIPNHPRTSEEYGLLGENFKELNAPIHPFYETLEDCWLYRFLQKHGIKPTHSEGDNPEKNSLAYHIVQHQKFEWLCKAFMYDRKPDVMIWMDYGIWHVPGVKPSVVKEFLQEVVRWDLAIPGCWKVGDHRIEQVGDAYPNWRYCGGLMVVPRNCLMPLYQRVRMHVVGKLGRTNNVSWEVNTLAAVEQLMPIRWYEADHNETMFTEYKRDKNHRNVLIRAADGQALNS